MRPHLAYVPFLLIFGASITGCADGQPSAAPTGPWSSEFEASLSRTTSDFEREILSDGEILIAEYREAVSKYVECMDDKGVELTINEQDGYNTFSFPEAVESEFDRVSPQCRLGTIEEIEPLYVGTLTNPNNIPASEAIPACLQAAGVVDQNAPADEVWDDFQRATRGESSSIDANDPLVAQCIADPYGSDPTMG